MSSGKPSIISYYDREAEVINKSNRNFIVGLSGQEAKDRFVPWDTLNKKPEKLVAFLLQKHQEAVLKNNPDCMEDCYKELRSIIAYLRLRGIRLILFTPPFFYREAEQRNVKTIRKTKQLMTDLQNKFNVEYYDFSVDPEFIYNKRYYSDGTHLNATGAHLFSKILENLYEFSHS